MRKKPDPKIKELEESEEAALDDGRFGLNDPEHPVIKAAMLLSTAAVEDSGVSDSQHGGKILISSGARIAFRKVMPDWAKVRNKWLNMAIANAFSTGNPADFFKPKGVGANVGLTGEIRMSGGTKYIAVIMENDDVRVIAVKGTPSGIGTPVGEAIPRRNPVPGSKPSAIDFGAGRVASALKGH